VPTSLHIRSDTVARPRLKPVKEAPAPTPVPVKLPALAPAPVGWYLAQLRRTPSGELSLPKLGVATLLALSAVTVAANALPARMGPTVTPDTWKEAGAAMKLVLPIMLSPAEVPLPVWLALTLTWPTSPYCKLAVATPAASKRRV